MAYAVQGLIYLAGMSAFVCLAIYAQLASSGRSRLLYSTWHPKLSTPRMNTFFAFATIAFLFCIYTGVESALRWMPLSWGGFDEGGDFTPLSASVAGTFALYFGLLLATTLDRGTHDAFTVRLLSTKCAELEKLLDASFSDLSLRSLRDRLEDEIKKIDVEQDSTFKKTLPNYEWHLWPEGQRRIEYSHLVRLVEKQQAQLQQLLTTSAGN